MAQRLIDRVKASTVDEAQAEAVSSTSCNATCRRQVADVRQQHLPGPALPRPHHAALESFFHYRNLDVSTLKELARRWKPDILAGFQQGAGAHGARRHRGIDRRAAYYRQHFWLRRADGYRQTGLR
jgi:oligoribonuclease